MAKIKDSKPKTSSGGYERVFNDKQIGDIIQKVQSTVIRNGNELEGIIKQQTSLISDLLAFTNDVKNDLINNGIYLCPKNAKNRRLFVPRGHDPDLLIFTLCNETKKCFKDSGLFGSFENFFTQQNKNSFEDLKQSFVDFYHNFTPVRGEYEPKRIFSRVLNPLSLKYRKLGTERGRMSPHIITKSDLMYNRDNFRDVYKDKPKEISRKDWLVQHPEIHIRTGYFEQQMNAAKNQLRMVNDIYRHNISELTQFIQGETDDIPASQIHHIFPRNEFPEIMYYPENLIALTPNQHFMFAHPNNNTQIIDIGNQKTLLIAKTYSIRKNLTEEDRKIYDFDNLLLILNVGWDDDSVLEIETGNYNDVIHSINCHYALI